MTNFLMRGRVIAAAVLLSVSLATAARADEVITRIAIAAPPAKVWAILTDFASYPPGTRSFAALRAR